MLFGFINAPPEWLPALATSGVLLAALAGLKLITKSGIEKGVQHVLDTRLENVKAEFRAREKEIETRIQQTSTQLSDLKSGVLETSRARSALLMSKRFEAAETLWSDILDHRKMLYVATMAASMDMRKYLEGASKQTIDGKNMRDFAIVITSDIDLKKLKPLDRHRLYVSSVTWALCRSYTQAIIWGVAQFMMAKVGGGPDSIRGPDNLLAQLSAALPSRASDIAARGIRALEDVLGELEEAIIAQLISDIEGRELDATQMRHASEILKLAESTQGDLRSGLSETSKPAV